MNSKRIVALLLAGLLALASGPLACKGTRSVPNPNPKGDQKDEPIDPNKRDPKVADFKMGDTLEVPFILWGGDVATFYANGGLKPKKGTLFEKQGLKLNLVRGDDFDKQVEAYRSGKSPFLRGTMSMLGQASEKLAADGRTLPVVFLQLTWSAGDHLVSRAGLKTLADLKGKKIALQKGGPHVGMLNDILRTARLEWSDITPVWTDDVTGDKGPAEQLRKDQSVQACFAITPDMESLTGGLDKTGSGDKKTVKDAHVLVSTAYMSRSIADVYACRKDFFDKHKDVVEKFAAGYLKGCEELVAMKKPYQEKKDAPKYKALLKLTQEIFGKNDVPDEAAADGLVSDAAFVGLPGNKSFFTDKGNLSGFQVKMRAALDLAVALKDAERRHGFLTADWDYDKLRKLGDLSGQDIPANRFREDVKFLIKDTIYVFTISFQPNEKEFSEAQYGEDFQRALEMASLFGNTVMAIRGHADPSSILVAKFKEAALAKGIIKQGAGEFLLKDGTKLDLNDVKKIVEIINKEQLRALDGRDLQQLVKDLQTLSEGRAEKVRDAVVNYATSRNYRLDKSQIKAVGAGGLEPVVAQAQTDEDLKKNRRVEFRIIKVPAEAINSGDIDY
jgi:ABC-type nitrate/sulfonate/bicarbonate transport system substrate-binding protein